MLNLAHKGTGKISWELRRTIQIKFKDKLLYK